MKLKGLFIVNVLIADIVILFSIGFSSLALTPVSTVEPYLTKGRIFYGLIPMALSILTAASGFLLIVDRRDKVKKMAD